MWLAERGEDGELVFEGTVKALSSSVRHFFGFSRRGFRVFFRGVFPHFRSSFGQGIAPDLWVTELEGMEADGLLPGFFGALYTSFFGRDA